MAPNQICEIIEGETPAPIPGPAAAPARAPGAAESQSVIPSRKASPPLFVEAGGQLDQARPPTSADDFTSQSMLPLKLSALGPGVSWLDVTADGWDDLLLPDGDGNSALTILTNDHRGGFVRAKSLGAATAPAWGQGEGSAITAALGFPEAKGTPTILAALSRRAPAPAAGNGTTSGPAVVAFRFPNSLPGDGPADLVARSESSAGPLALADLDGDGDLDLFVGGRFLPGRWPEPASSAIYLRQADGRWTVDTVNAKTLEALGLVSGAVFSDLDGDGDPDLVLASDWGALRIFTNDHGRLTPSDWRVSVTGDAGPGIGRNGGPRRLSELTGWWTGVTAGDFDGDGLLDLVAGNSGRNTRYERFGPSPIRVYFGDFAGDGSVALLECAFDRELGKYAPLYDVWTLSKSIPWLLERFDGYEKFARAGIEEVLGDRLSAARLVEAAWADSTLFLNRGDHFEVRTLPREAQVAPVFGVCVADFDGDAREDLFLSQNLFAVRPDATRQDAGRGLILRGDGRGGFSAMPAAQSGVSIYGEQRGAAVADFDRDGRVDLAVRQFGGSTRLLRNAAARPGWRVRLSGPSANPQAIGSVLRIGHGGSWGPAREVHAGSGYWSQDSATAVLARSPSDTELQVRWPDGAVSTTPLDSSTGEIIMKHP
jgi:hypothetical protein